MNKQPIIQTLRELLPLTQPHESLVHFNPLASTYRLFENRQVTIAPEFEQRLISVLSSDPDLQIFHDAEIRTSPNSGASGSLFWQIAHWMLAQARKRSPDEVVDTFEVFFKANQTRALEILTLWGIHPTQSIELVDGIKLVPLSALPDSVSKDELLGINTYNTTYQSSGYVPKATAALVREFVHEPVIIARSIPHDQRRSIQPDTQIKLMLDIARCLILVDTRSVSPINYWYHNDEGLPFVGGDFGGGGFAFEWAFLFPPDPKPYDAQSVNELVTHYVSLVESVRNQLRIPLTRLNRAMKGTEASDIAIDLGIALEALLTQELDSNTDLSYKIRLRGTTFLGGTSGERKVNFELFKVLYTLRSKAAHGSDLAEKVSAKLSVDTLKQPVYIGQVFDKGKIMCAHMLRKAIATGRLPDWDALVIGW